MSPCLRTFPFRHLHSVRLGTGRSFGLNHYGTKWATGKVELKGQVSGFQFFGAGVEQVAEKDGVLIGRKGHNGHPHTGQLTSRITFR